jgi:hypothetical protein
MYRPYKKDNRKELAFQIEIIRHEDGALEASIETFDGLREGEKRLVGSPNGRTSEHGFFTTLGLAIGEQFKKA